MDNVDYKAVRRAALALSLKSDEERVAMLLTVADALDARRQEIEKANVLDIDQARRQGMGEALIHRLALPSSKLDGAIAGVRAVAAQKSPVGLVRQRRLLDEGLVLEQVTYPIGVIGMIFEARPDALIQIVSLAIKSANGLILKGGREAQRTNACLVDIIRSCLDGAPFIALISSHEDVDVMLRMEGEVDLIIPRGSASFVRHVMDNTHIPVLGHADGICSVYIHSQANLDEAVAIAVDSKVQYPAACNAAETILVDRAIAPRFIPAFQKALREYGVIIHADGPSLSRSRSSGIWTRRLSTSPPTLRTIRTPSSPRTPRPRRASSAKSTRPTSSATARRASPTATASVWEPRWASRRARSTPVVP